MSYLHFESRTSHPLTMSPVDASHGVKWQNGINSVTEWGVILWLHHVLSQCLLVSCQPNKIMAELTFHKWLVLVYKVHNDIWMLQTKTTHLWKVSYAIIFLGWQSVIGADSSIVFLVLSSCIGLIKPINDLKENIFPPCVMPLKMRSEFKWFHRAALSNANLWQMLLANECKT